MRVLRLLGSALICFASAAGQKDPCECLNWKDLYSPYSAYPATPTSSRLLCGEANEFLGMSQDFSFAYYAPFFLGFQYHEFCRSFYHKMDNNYCVNMAMAEYGETGRQAAQWCVVSKECTELNGGAPIPDKKTFYHGPTFMLGVGQWWRDFWDYITPSKPVPRDVSWKICTKDKDKMLRHMEPLEVMELAKSMDSVIGYVTKMSYMRLMPSGPEGKPGGSDWAHVEDLVRKGDIEKMPKPLKDAIAANEPIVIDVDPNGHTHQRIVHGKKVYELDNYCDASGCGGKQWPFKQARDVGEL